MSQTIEGKTPGEAAWEAAAPERKRLAREAARAWGEAAAMWEEAPKSMRDWAREKSLSIVWEWGKESPEEARRFAQELRQSETALATGGSFDERVCAGMAWLGAEASSEEELPVSVEIEIRWETPGEPQYAMRNTQVTEIFQEARMARYPEEMAACVRAATLSVMNHRDWESEEEGEIPGYDFLDGYGESLAKDSRWGREADWARIARAVSGAFERELLEEATPAAREPARSSAGARI